MPRSKPKPKGGARTFQAYAHVLSDGAARELSELLGLDDETWEDVRFRIEQWLGAYPGAVGALDQAPRPVNYRAALSRMGKSAYTTLHLVVEANQFIREAITSDLPTPTMQGLHAIEMALAELFDACTKAFNRLGSGESQGRPTHEALRAIVAELRGVFATFYRGGDSRRRKDGVIESLSERENDEREFVRIALADARINHPADIGPLFLARPTSAGTPKRKPKARTRRSRGKGT